MALDEGDFDEITAFVGGQKAAFVAVASPRRPNQGLMKRDDIRESLKPVPRPGRWLGYRVAEYHASAAQNPCHADLQRGEQMSQVDANLALKSTGG